MQRRKFKEGHDSHGFQMPLFQPQGTWQPTPVSQLPSWKGARRVGVDIETKDPQIKELGPGPRRDGRITGVSFAIEDGPEYYLPVRHAGGDNLPAEHVFAYLRDQAKEFDGDVGGMNLGYDLDFLAEEGVLWPKVKFFRDVQIAEVLINELNMSYSLEAIGERWELKGKDEAELRNAAMMAGIGDKDIKKKMWQLAARYVAAYACHDARNPLAILRKQEREIENQELWPIYNLESRVLPVLVKMRRKGVRIDLDRLEGVERWCLHEEKEALEKVKHATGINLPIGAVWKNAMLVPVLSAIGIKLGRTPKGGPKIDKNTLDNIDHPVAEALLWARKTNKLRTTFAASIREHMVKGRIHCVFNQMARADEEEEDEIKGARYGRLSSEHPNMQQQPARDEFAKRWRSIYIPEDGAEWASLDYSQQEPRVLVHYAELAGCTRAEEAATKYRTDLSTDHHQMMADLTGLKRSYAKIVYLGLCYGMGGAKLARSLGLPTDIKQHKSGKLIEVAGPEAQEILDKFNNHAPFVRELAQRCQRVAEQRGYIVTLGGRRCRFPKDALGNYDWCQKALNRLIQGSSADQTKTAMVMADAAGHELQLQVHDELDTSVSGEKQAEEIAEIMRTCVPLRVPSKVDVEIGPSWGEVE